MVHFQEIIKKLCDSSEFSLCPEAWFRLYLRPLKFWRDLYNLINSMGKKLLLLLFVTFSTLSFAQQRPGSLRGVVTDAKTGETVPFANVVIKDASGSVITGGSTDIDGKYNINPVSPGTYTVEASFTGYALVKITGVVVSPNSPTLQDFRLQEESAMLTEVTITYEAPLIDKTKSSKVTTAEDIQNMAVRDTLMCPA